MVYQIVVIIQMQTFPNSFICERLPLTSYFFEQLDFIPSIIVVALICAILEVNGIDLLYYPLIKVSHITPIFFIHINDSIPILSYHNRILERNGAPPLSVSPSWINLYRMYQGTPICWLSLHSFCGKRHPY